MVANIWNGSRDSEVFVEFDRDGEVLPMDRVQAGKGEGFVEFLDPFALERQLYIFSSERRSLTFETQPASASGAWLEYLGQGVIHILGGVDHLLFLLTLLLSLLRRRARASAEGAPESASPSSLRSTLLNKIVTAFTAAHSLTLTVMALGLVALPTRWVATAIALSIVAAAANNVWPVVRRRVWLLAFGFGLLHGLGFGSALRELGLPEGRLLIALLGFNLGVEIGQLGGGLFPRRVGRAARAA